LEEEEEEDDDKEEADGLKELELRERASE